MTRIPTQQCRVISCDRSFSFLHISVVIMDMILRYMACKGWGRGGTTKKKKSISYTLLSHIHYCWPISRASLFLLQTNRDAVWPLKGHEVTSECVFWRITSPRAVWAVRPWLVGEGWAILAMSSLAATERTCYLTHTHTHRDDNTLTIHDRPDMFALCTYICMYA